MIEQASAKADAQAQIAGVLNDVYSRYIALWAVQELQQIRKKNQDDLLSLKEPIDRTIKAGQGNLVELYLLDAEISAEEVEKSALESIRLGRSASLGNLLAKTDGTVIHVDAPSGFPIPRDSSPLENFAIHRTPLRVAIGKREEAAQARLAIARADRFGGMEAGLLSDFNSDTGESSVGIGFSFDLPIWNQNKAGIATAEAEVIAAQNSLSLIEPSRVASVVRLRHQSALAAESSAREYRKDVLPKFQLALTQAREALEKGQGGVNQIQLLINRITETRLRAFELEIEALEARAQLEAVLGGRIEEALGASVDN